MCKWCAGSHVDQRTRDGVLEGFKIMREWRSGSTQDRQDATVRLIRGVGVPRIMLWHASGSSS
eukprot:2073689-Pyramimonas_sp.AAC.1